MRGFPIACLLLVVSAPARAEHRLHERVDEPSRDEGPLVEQPAEGENPEALRLGGRELPEPRHDEQLASGELPFEAGPGQEGTIGRAPVWRPDVLTDVFPEHLQYTATFEPTVSPHKRVAVFDEVGARYELSVADSRLVEVEIGGAAAEGREVFWGSVAVRFRPHRPVPIPSVASGARILSVRARPDREVRFLRDGADNYYAVSPSAGQTRLVFVTDAPASYFGGPLPPAVRSSDVPERLRPSLPGAVQAAARRVIERLGLDEEAPMARNLARLVTYLRSFEPEALSTPAGADPYLTLAFGRRGVCRHRAFVFVVTAQALGIPARFVTNEAHAFAEAYLPTEGWRRFDLGGAGPLAEPSSSAIHHEPREGDPIPWPRGRARSGSSPRRPAQTRESGPQRARSEREAGTPSRRGAASTGGAPAVATGGEIPEQPGAPAAERADETPPTPPRARVVVDESSRQVIRGESLRVSGHLEGRGGGLGDAHVVVRLRSADGRDEVLLGRTIPDGEGRFSVVLNVPADLPAGDYAVTADLAGR